MSDHDFSLIMPFVVCASQGGPYDDTAFVAGYECGLVDAELAAKPGVVTKTVRAASMPQVDLIAMRHGFTVDAEPWEDGPDEWVSVVLTPSAVVPS